MIPKIIHYCWFGGKPKNQQIVENINKWRIVYPDYRIIEWNEDNFDVNKYKFTKQAYYARKYAFVSDVARLCALVEYGGFYFDTDIIACKPFDDKILKANAVLGFEQEILISTAFMACTKDHPFFRNFLQTYNDKSFFNLKLCFKNKSFYDMTPNTRYLKQLLVKNGLNPNNTIQTIGDIQIYPQIFFSAKEGDHGKIFADSNTYVIHNFACSWRASNLNFAQKIYIKLNEFITMLKYYIS